jgi:hypothetical protein
LVIIDDLNPLDAPIPPNEAEPPVVVDPNAVLARSAAAQSLQPISGRRRQIAEVFRGVQLPQLPLGYSLHARRELPCVPTMKQRLGFAIGERADHSFRLYTHSVQIAKRTY